MRSWKDFIFKSLAEIEPWVKQAYLWFMEGENKRDYDFGMYPH